MPLHDVADCVFLPFAELGIRSSCACSQQIQSMSGVVLHGFVPPGAVPLTMVASGSYFHRMRTVALKILNSKLSEYIRLAASGETVLVTDRDRVVAEIVPPRQERSPILADALLPEEVRRGRLTPPALANTGPPPTPAPVTTFDVLMAELDEDRADR